MDKERTLISEKIFEGKVITVCLDTVEIENDMTTTREVVKHGGGAGVVAINEKGEVALVRQFRYALGKELLEIPAGKIEKGEEPRKTALRELEEEAACKANTLIAFGSIIPTCGYCNEIIYLFLAKDLEESVQHLDDDEFVSFFWVPLEDAVEMVWNGQITDSKTVVGLLKAKALKDKGEL